MSTTSSPALDSVCCCLKVKVYIKFFVARLLTPILWLLYWIIHKSIIVLHFPLWFMFMLSTALYHDATLSPLISLTPPCVCLQVTDGRMNELLSSCGVSFGQVWYCEEWDNPWRGKTLDIYMVPPGPLVSLFREIEKGSRWRYEGWFYFYWCCPGSPSSRLHPWRVYWPRTCCPPGYN